MKFYIPLVVSLANLNVLQASPPSCSFTGYFPYPGDCSQFFRCASLWGVGAGETQLQQFVFQCAQGTVFDPSLSVCNWPSAVPGCGGGIQEEEEAGGEAEEAAVSETEETTTEMEELFRPQPGSSYACSSPGIFNNTENCSKFWLCKETKEGSKFLESLLYRCPEGYIFSSPSLRCEKEENVLCSLPQSSQDFRGVSFTQLQEEDLENFFKRFG